MSTPVATVADALIAFILSLLRDPAAVEEFNAQPSAVMKSNGLEDVCAADVQQVKPVIVDHPDVHPRPPAPPHPEPPDIVHREIARIVNQFTTIENRPTIIDQSTNQNIWTNGGDVTQIFDQEAVVAVGDDSIAAGDDATKVDSDVDVTVGDVSIGNEHHTNSHNTDVDAADNSGTVVVTDGEGTVAAEVADGTSADDMSGAAEAAGDAVAGAVDAAVDATATVQAIVEPAPEPVAPAPAEESLASDMTATTDTYEADTSSAAPVDDTYYEEPIEED